MNRVETSTVSTPANDPILVITRVFEAVRRGFASTVLDGSDKLDLYLDTLRTPSK